MPKFRGASFRKDPADLADLAHHHCGSFVQFSEGAASLASVALGASAAAERAEVVREMRRADGLHR